ncbi:MAG: hypothetical protein ACJ787_13395, partial [Myxococcales bacterium]
MRRLDGAKTWKPPVACRDTDRLIATMDSVADADGAVARRDRAGLARHFDLDAASVPFFFKQWGGVRKSLAGRVFD